MRRARTEVVLHGLHNSLTRALWKLDEAWRDATGHELTIYSARDSEHGRGSLHYVGCAADIRTWNDPADPSSGQMSGEHRANMLGLAGRTCGTGFDVIDEGTHFHIEYHPQTQSEMEAT